MSTTQAFRRSLMRSACQAVAAAWAAVRCREKRPEWPAATFAVASAAVIVLLNNHRLFALTAESVDLASFAGLACLLTIYLLITGMVALFFLIFGHRYTLKPLVIAAFLLSATLGYFTREFGAVFDEEMIRNIVEAFRDRSAREAGELVSLRFLAHVALYGVLPSLLARTIRIRFGTPRRELALRALHAGGLTVLLALLFAVNLRYLIYFSREHLSLRYYATPTFAIHSLRKFVTQTWCEGQAPFVEIGADAVRRKSGPSRMIGVLVVGETARADHFSLNGYPRKTNPRLERRTLLNYPDARASGTSTAYSVPAIFSFLGKKRYTPDAAALQSNVLDVLVRTGVHVVWIDNNSGPKGVCDRIGFVDFWSCAAPDSPRDSDGGFYDEAMIGEARRQIDATAFDLLLVLHTMGSHGPAYYKRYPPPFEAFTPVCRQRTPQGSSAEEVVNAYDNTILYTDSVLDGLIALLESRGECAFLMYVSDHGESLGENGLYLHGAPEFMAPPAQTHVPLLAWLSPRLLAERGLDYQALQGRTAESCSHDNLPHSLLGLFEVQTALYREGLNLFRSKGP